MRKGRDPRDKSVVVILGAGASKILGFPLQKDIWDFIFERCGVDDRKYIGRIYRDYGTDIEEAFTIANMAVLNKDLNLIPERVFDPSPLQHLKSIIADTFSAVRFPQDGIVVYRGLINELRKFRSVTFISLNWDTGLERILRRMHLGVNYGIQFDYDPLASSLDLVNPRPKELMTLKRFKPKTFLVLKPHGSINWNFCLMCRRLSCHRYSFSRSVKFSDSLPTLCYCLLDSPSMLETVIVPPILNKGNNFHYFDSVSRLIHQNVVAANILIFIGYSFREADYDMKFILASAIEAKNNVKMREPWLYDPSDFHVVVFGDKRSAKKIVRFLDSKLQKPSEIMYANYFSQEIVEKLPGLFFP